MLYLVYGSDILAVAVIVIVIVAVVVVVVVIVAVAVEHETAAVAGVDAGGDAGVETAVAGSLYWG